MRKEEVLSYTDKLPPLYAKILQLYLQEKRTQREIGKELDISLYKVRGYLSKAMYLVRKEAGDSELEKARSILFNSRA